MRIVRLMSTLPPAPLAADGSTREGARITREIVLDAQQQRVLYGLNRPRKNSVLYQATTLVVP
jgi:hypothetical protein